MKDIVNRIEDKVISSLRNLKQPTKALLGRKEYRALVKSFTPTERIRLKPTNMKPTNVKRVYFANAQIEIVKTKHKSYLRVV